MIRQYIQQESCRVYRLAAKKTWRYCGGKPMSKLSKEIISHPNTPAYIQAIAVIIATCVGLNYLKKRAAERKFDLVVKTYKYCLEACDVLINLKQAPVLFKNRDAVEEYENK